MDKTEGQRVGRFHYTIGLDARHSRPLEGKEKEVYDEYVKNLGSDIECGDRIYDGYLSEHGLVYCKYKGHECYVTIGQDVAIHHWKVVLATRIFSLYNTRKALGSSPAKKGGRKLVRERLSAFNGMLGDIQLLITELLAKEHDELPELIKFDAEVLLGTVRKIQKEVRK